MKFTATPMAILTGFSLLLASVLWASEPTTKAAASSEKPITEKTTQMVVHKGLNWLLERQQANGGWGPGHTTEGEAADVGNTCVAIQAIWRAGIRPGSPGKGSKLNKAMAFVLSEIEASDEASLFVTSQKGTQLQRKLGTYVDTFLAAATLAEMKDQMGNTKANQRLAKALSKVTAKIEKNQREDGSWQNEGWAPALAQGLAAKGINKAAQNGVRVSKETLKKAERFGRDQYDKKTKSFDSSGTAGVELYGVASSMSTLEESVRTNRREKADLERRLPVAGEAEQKQIRQDLDEIEANEQTLANAQDSLVERLSDDRFVAGFGSNGGEEFLSYLQISESLHRKGGSEWQAWNKGIKTNLTRVQDEDGCWRGKHCITGGTFCTATALLVLTEENAKRSLADAFGGKTQP